MITIRYLALALCLMSSIYSSQYPHAAAKMPIAFAVVREDAAQDAEIIKRYFPEEKISMLMVASGGCTAAQLISSSALQDITLVDPNKAQLDLSKFKIQLLTLPVEKRLAILGYSSMASNDRKTIMLGYMKVLNIDENSFGDIDIIAQEGLDFSGRYEKVFETLRNRLANHRDDLEALFSFDTIAEQIQHIAPETIFGKALDEALDEIMSQNNLVILFGQKATANRVQDFSRHFAQRIRTYLSLHLASQSPWLANMLLGNFKNGELFPWLHAEIQNGLPQITYLNKFMNDALRSSEPESYHVIHLSNIIDWLSPEEAQETLELAYKALKPGGIVIIRQLNSNINIAAHGKEFNWNLKVSNEFLNEDRSFFYRKFLIGFKDRPSQAAEVQAMADEILRETPVIKGSFFQDLATMDKEVFKKVQSQFYFAVNYFSRPMAALIARMPLHKDRINIIHNIVEEHGDFNASRYHSNTFKTFLSTLDIASESIDLLMPSPVVNMFNYTLMAACANEDPIIALACNGIIEYAFADISALIAETVVHRNWVKKEDLVHYNLHADIDKIHAEDFFKVISYDGENEEVQKKIMTGLRLGAYIFNRLYEDLYVEAQK